jgi:hypothetical protein
MLKAWRDEITIEEVQDATLHSNLERARQLVRWNDWSVL